MRKLCFLLLTFLMLQPTHGTERVDNCVSEFDKHNTVEAANNFFKTLYDEQFTDELYSFKCPVHSDSMAALVWYWAAEYYYEIDHDYHRSIDYAEHALPYCEQMNDLLWRSDCYGLLSFNYFYLSDWQNAAYYAKRTYDIDALRNDIDRMSSTLNSLAGIYVSAKQYTMAKQYIDKALKLTVQVDNPVRRAVILGTASEVYNCLKEYDKALEYVSDAYDIEVSLGRYHKAAVRQAQKAAIMIAKEQYQQAQQLLTQAIDTLSKYQNTHSLAIAYIKMGDVRLAMHDESTATHYYNKGLQLCLQTGNIYNTAQAHLGLYRSLRETNPQQAMQHIDYYNDIKDSLYNLDSSIVLADYEAQYQLAELDNQLTRQSRLNTILITVGSVVLLLLVIMLIVFLLYRYKAKKNIATVLNEYERLMKKQSVSSEVSDVKNDSDNDNKSEADIVFTDCVMSIISEQLDHGAVSVDVIAQRLGMSLFQFRTRLLSATGQRPHEFVQSVRMARACYLLNQRKDLSVNDISEMCGYNDTPNFIRSFKRIYGVTPMQYRTQVAS